jgi:hypothetical protein
MVPQGNTDEKLRNLSSDEIEDLVGALDSAEKQGDIDEVERLSALLARVRRLKGDATGRRDS